MHEYVNYTTQHFFFNPHCYVKYVQHDHIPVKRSPPRPRPQRPIVPIRDDDIIRVDPVADSQHISSFSGGHSHRVTSGIIKELFLHISGMPSPGNMI